MNETITTTGGNRLRHAKSPYLLQHAQDPVHWYAWGPEAFQAARREDKPIFLSIGYSTCHWCHVMGRETFRDRLAAEALNRAFISIKVDREERPDIDAVYMAACQALTGSGGWPLTILMTPDQKPFWAGTYLPPRGLDGGLGLVELLDEVERLWQSDRDRLLELGQRVTDHLSRRKEAAPETPAPALFHEAVRQFRESFDAENGGFGGAPKFPSPHQLLFLLEYDACAHSPEALEMAEVTLTQMARGGIFDQTGGGFCRYSTDAAWMIPHFEKMLYDNALLAYVYLHAGARTKRPWYHAIARRTLEYVLRELRLPWGGFACGQDADSEGEEGRYYLLTKREVCSALESQEAGERFCRWYGMDGKGEQIPNLLENGQYDSSPFVTELEKLADYRRRRCPLHRDNKVVTGWNAMMVAALAKAYRVLGEKRYLRAAESTRMFLRTRLTAPDGTLYHCWREGEAAADGQLDDYAYYCWALLELYAANFSTSCLREAVTLADKLAELFWDRESGGFYCTAADSERLIVRQKEVWDGPFAAGNAVAALALGRLWHLTGEGRFRQLWQRQLAWLAGQVKAAPSAGCGGLLAALEAQYPAGELVCVSAEGTPAWLAGTAEEYHLLALAKTPDNSRALGLLAAHAAAIPIPRSGQMLYPCRDGSCGTPVCTREQLLSRLAERAPAVAEAAPLR